MRTFAAVLSMRSLGLTLLMGGCASQRADALPSWTNGPARLAITTFVDRVTRPGPDFVAPEARIAVFDNDGTLWTESPMYPQIPFALDRLRAMAPEHPEWRTQEPFCTALAGDMHALAAYGSEGMFQIVMAPHANTTTEEFAAVVEDWLRTASHPALRRPYTAAVYQPMVELLDYLRDEGFTTYIVSGGEVEFMRPWTEGVYGVPPHQVVGTTLGTRYGVREAAYDRHSHVGRLDRGLDAAPERGWLLFSMRNDWARVFREP